MCSKVIVPRTRQGQKAGLLEKRFFGTRRLGVPISVCIWVCSVASTSANATENGAALSQRRYVASIAEQDIVGPHAIEDIAQLEASGRYLGKSNDCFVDFA